MKSSSVRWGVALLAIAAVTLWASAGMAATILVPGDQPTIQAGIDAAVDGDLVLVALGTYVENINFLGKEIIVLSESGSDVTAIDGNQAGSVVKFESGETGEAVIEGFTIRNGDTNAGGGIFCWSSYPTITNCTITGNVSSFVSGGLGEGGGIYCGNASPTIMNCKILENNGSRGGGLGICGSSSSPTIMNCTITGNISDSFRGGGIYCSYSSPWITNCTISENSASGAGGGIDCSDSSLTITNCTITGNTADDLGGGIRCFDSSLTITNCILWGDSASDDPEIFVSSGSPVVTYSDVQGAGRVLEISMLTLSFLEKRTTTSLSGPLALIPALTRASIPIWMAKLDHWESVSTWGRMSIPILNAGMGIWTDMVTWPVEDTTVTIPIPD